MNSGPSVAGDLLIGRYRVHDEIAAGGMATVHLGRLVGDVGFSRTVAIKRLHRYHAKDPEIVKSFTDEARIAARIRHPNVVPTLDVISQDGEVFLIMEYVHGEPLSRLIVATNKRKEKIPPRIVAAVMSSALHGLHAAHEAKDSVGRPLGVVHRDISPQNIIVGVDGVARVLDFGIARAAGRLVMTTDGAIKGKLAYMAPEHIRGEEIDRRADIYASGVVLWESLTCRRLHSGNAHSLAVERAADGNLEAPSSRVPDLPKIFDEIALRALRRRADERYPTAAVMAEALEATGMLATTSEITAWVLSLANETLDERARVLDRIDNDERRAASPTHQAPIMPIVDDPTTEQVDVAAPKQHRVESTIKMSSSNLVRVTPPDFPPPPPPRESSPVRTLETTIMLDSEQNQPQGLFSSSATNPRVDVPLPLAHRASSVPIPEPGVSTVELPAQFAIPVPKYVPEKPHPAQTRPAFYWGAWIAAAIVLFVLTGVIVAVIVRGEPQQDDAPSPAVSEPVRH
jgi:serine/threonine protein kinase